MNTRCRVCMAFNPGHIWITRTQIATAYASRSIEHCQLTCDCTEYSKATSTVAHTGNLSVQEAKAGRSMWVQSQPRLYSEAWQREGERKECKRGRQGEEREGRRRGEVRKRKSQVEEHQRSQGVLSPQL